MNRFLIVGSLVCGCICLTMGSAHVVSAQVRSSGQANTATPSFQTRAEIAALPPSTNRNAVRAGFTPSAGPVSTQVGRYGSPFGTASARTDIYPYPATSRGSRVAFQPNYVLPQTVPNYVAPQNTVAARNPNQLSIGTNSTIKSLRNTAGRANFVLPPNYSAQRPALVTTAYQQPVYQSPTLGLGKTSIRGMQTCYCQPNYNPVASRTSVGYQAASPNSATGSGLAVPPLDVQVPGQQTASPLPTSGQSVSQSGYQYPSPAAAQSSQPGAGWWTPFVTGSGTYPAVIRRQNMPVGSYLGQGFIGQPTAYVDGQPIRNLLRYITP